MINPANDSQIILLNGTSSSGKTSLARALQSLLNSAYLYLSLDMFGEMFPDDYIDVEDEDLAETRKNKILSIMLDCITFLASSGNKLIVDHVLDESDYMPKLIKQLSHFKLTFISVICPLEILEERELQRKDRRIGLARSQFDNVHKGRLYDFEIDTSISTPEECAFKVINYIASANLDA